jgi:hypothetical protein
MAKLAIAEGDSILAKERYGGPGVEWCDDNPLVPGKYDLVVLYNWLQLAEQPKVMGLIRYYVSMLKDGGQLIVVVPSLDWAANEIAFRDNPSVAAFVAIYGTPQEPHRCGFTMNWLRLVLSQNNGLLVDYANVETIKISHGDQSEEARQNAIMCSKVVVEEAVA